MSGKEYRSSFDIIVPEHENDMERYKDTEDVYRELVVSKWYRIEEDGNVYEDSAINDNYVLQKDIDICLNITSFPFQPIVSHQVGFLSTNKNGFLIDKQYQIYAWGDQKLTDELDGKTVPFKTVAITQNNIGIIDNNNKFKIMSIKDNTKVDNFNKSSLFRKVTSFKNHFLLLREDGKVDIYEDNNDDTMLTTLLKTTSEFSMDNDNHYIDIFSDNYNIFLVSDNNASIFHFQEIRNDIDKRYNLINIQNKLISSLYFELYPNTYSRNNTSYTNIKQIVSNSLGFCILYNNGTVQIKYYNELRSELDGNIIGNFVKPDPYFLNSIDYIVSNNRIFSCYSQKNRSIVTFGKLSDTSNTVSVEIKHKMRQVVATNTHHIALDLSRNIVKWGNSVPINIDANLEIEYLFASRNVFGIVTLRETKKKTDAYNPSQGIFCNRNPLQNTVRRTQCLKNVADGFGRNNSFETVTNQHRNIYTNANMSRRQILKWANTFRYR